MILGVSFFGEIHTEYSLLDGATKVNELFDRIKEVILSIHPYDVPEIISLQIKDGNNPYLNWINDNTK